RKDAWQDQVAREGGGMSLLTRGDVHRDDIILPRLGEAGVVIIRRSSLFRALYEKKKCSCANLRRSLSGRGVAFGLCQIKSLRTTQPASCIAIANLEGINRSCFSCRIPPIGVFRRRRPSSDSPCRPFSRMLA